MTHPPPSRIPPRVRVVRLWPARNPDQLRVEYDPQPDRTFSGLWTTRQDLPDILRWLYPDIEPHSIEEIFYWYQTLVDAQDESARYLELKRELPASETPPAPCPTAASAPTEISDFEW